MNLNDDSAALIQRVEQAVSQKTPLTIQGGCSKQMLGGAAQAGAVALNTTNHTGIISYEPTELVVSVRVGTSLQALNQVLDDAGQMLPFDPPVYDGSTVGGTIACGLSGPRRPFTGAARDYVLGTRIINGLGQDLSFGGEVMKNVAGYDVSRLQVGAYGTLGLLLDISMKVLPKPETELTIAHDLNIENTACFTRLLRQPLPLSGAMLIEGRRYIRLSGSESAVSAAAKQLGGDLVAEGNALWSAVRDQSHPFFRQSSDGQNLWRVSVPDFTPLMALQGEWLYEWAGAQRWLKTAASAEEVFAAAAAAGGHATRYAQGDSSTAFQPIEGVLRRLQSRLRDSFDPDRLFNRARFHPELDTAVDLPESASA